LSHVYFRVRYYICEYKHDIGGKKFQLKIKVFFNLTRFSKTKSI